MVTFAILTLFVALYFMQDNGVLTEIFWKKALYIVLLIISAVLLSLAYGTLRGVFIFIGLLSLLGTLFTLFLYQYQSKK